MTELPVRIDRDDPVFRAAVTAVVDGRLNEIITTWADRVTEAGWPEAGAWMRQQVRQP